MLRICKQKRILELFLQCVILLVSPLSTAVADAVKIMPLGDSITKGTGSAHSWGYREPLYVNLINGRYNFDFVGSLTDGNFADPNHEGHYGWRADEILNGQQTDPNAGKLEYWLNANQPDIVLLHIGTNDITQGNQDANEVNAILNVVDEYEVENSKTVTVILALIINRYPYSPATTAYNNDVNNMALSRIANGDHIIIVNMENALNYPADLADNLHPNDTGYAKMADVWYPALTGILVPQNTLTCSSTQGGSVTQPGEGTFLYDPNTTVVLTAAADMNYLFVHWTGTAVDAGKVADPNSAGTTVTMVADYNVVANFVLGEENMLKETNHRLELRTSGRISDFEEFDTSNCWSLDTSKDLAIKTDFHFSKISTADASIGMSVGDDINYVSISVGSDGNSSYFHYEATVDGNVASEYEPRTSSDGTLYVSFDSASKKFYLSHTGFGSENAYVWEASNPTQGRWELPVYVSIGGGSAGVALSPGDAYLDNFEIDKAGLLGWPPANDIDGDGFIDINDLEILCENWLSSGQGDIDNSGKVDFFDLAELGPAW